MVGGRSFTILGKPTVPYATVKATIEQQTLAGEKLIFKYKRRRRSSNFYRRRQYVTMLRIDEIVVDEKAINPAAEEPPKPDRLLDLWANRWLDEEEKALIPRNPVPTFAGRSRLVWNCTFALASCEISRVT